MRSSSAGNAGKVTSESADRVGLYAFKRIGTVLLVVALSLANSLLFYFVIWDMLTPSQPFTVILFFVSGGAHLIYFFLPWFTRAMLAPIFRLRGDDVGRFDGAAGGRTAQDENGFVRLCTGFGAGLCVTSFVLLSLQFNFSAPESASMALITKENCLQIGGKPEYVHDKLICVVPKSEIHSDRSLAVEPASDRV
jgi:putative hemolysin